MPLVNRERGYVITMAEATQAHRGDARGNGCIPDAAGAVNKAASVLRGTLSAALHLAASPPQAERLLRVHALCRRGEDMIVTRRQHHMHDHLSNLRPDIGFSFCAFSALELPYRGGSWKLGMYR